jgi:stage II sporulation protein R
MKKIICGFICLGILTTLFTNDYLIKGEDSSIQSSLSTKLIRFHVIANSDNAQDQALKLKVRDKVLEYISPKLKNSKSIEESRRILIANDEAIKKISEEIIRKNGYRYAIATELSKQKFPVKTYGNITLPQGEYEAYRILIGNGSGQNWWCVMFPPLCFIDITKGEVSYEETEKSMKQVLSEKEYEAIDNTRIEKEDKKQEAKEENKDKDKIIVKFKLVELIEKLLK